MRSRDKRSAVAWAFFLLILLFASSGTLFGADSGEVVGFMTETVSDGADAGHTLGGPGGANHGDPDDFDLVPPNRGSDFRVADGGRPLEGGSCMDAFDGREA